MAERIDEIKARLAAGYHLVDRGPARHNARALVGSDIEFLLGEVERLDHLHRLDHSSADQRERERDEARAEVERLRW